MPELVALLDTDPDTAIALYRARRPWRYDARFHVPPGHIRLVPPFQMPTPTE